jgi:hypothetical protein
MWENNVRLDFSEIGSKVERWMELAFGIGMLNVTR